MVVDPRHDHSMRIPRPDLSVKLGTPNACSNCHADQSAEWAASRVRQWYGKEPGGYQRYAEAFAAAREGEPAAGSALAELVRDSETPDIARATALAELGPYLSAATIDVIAQGLSEDDPAIRAADMRALESAPANIRVPLAISSLSDPVRAVRIEAARVLATVPAGDLSAGQRSLLDKGLHEYIEAQQAMAERPGAQVAIGNIHAALGEDGQAIAAYRTALELDPAYIPAYVNMADFHRSRRDEAKAEALLRQAAGEYPGSGVVHYALGLSLVRQKRTDEAVEAFKQAATLAPENARYAYVYAVALNSTGKTELAVMVLQGAHNRFVNNAEILNALVTFHRDSGNEGAAQIYADKLRAISP